MNKKCLSCVHCEVCSFIDSDTAKLEACDFYTEGCEDAISRQAVLDGLSSIAKAKAKSDAQKSLMGRVMFFTEHLPSVKPQEPKWIPVSERLPEKHGRYLAYIVGKYDTDYRYIMTCEYFESDLWCWFPDDECASDNVVAWMPLPEPYKAESEDI